MDRHDLSDGVFFEIEYDSHPIPGVGKFVMKPERIEKQDPDEIRERFTQMRDIARAHRTAYYYSKFFDRHVHHENAAIFYKQGVFMKDFTDNYDVGVRFSQYFPYYQLMGYEQLRTYFTWRTGVREGTVSDTSLSYAFLYLYELLGNIGVGCPLDGLDKLMSFWKAYRAYYKTIDTYVIRWLKDYHIYYELPHSFKEFIEKNDLTGHYSKVTDADDSFDLFCAISKYDIRKSIFFTDVTSDMIVSCFLFVLERIRRDFEAAGMHFDDALFRPTKKIVSWIPFRDALFYNWMKQQNRKVVLSSDEIYLCQNNEWTHSTVITSEKGRQFLAYVFKQMESVLRTATNYKFKLTAKTSMIHEDTVRSLTKAGVFIEKIVPDAVMEFYREATKTVVTVDPASLARIRREALATQEALIVEDPDQSIFADSADTQSADSSPFSGGWDGFKHVLSENEKQALATILRGDDIKALTDKCGVMPEVLFDGINEKAMDYIGDSLMDDGFVIYDEYRAPTEELLGWV